METNHIESPITEQKTKQKVDLKEHKVLQRRTLPEKLVGSRSTANVKVNGLECSSLLDTGSQVTTISLSFYNSHLSDQTIHPISDLLNIEGANGQSVPYLGYVKVTLQFPKEFMITEPEIETLALVVPDVRSNSITPLLIGTNALDPFYEQFCDGSFTPNKSYCGYHQVLKTLQLRHRQNPDGHHGFVHLKNTRPKLIPARQKVVLDGFANIDHITNDNWFLLEQPTVSSLPGGIFIDSCVIAFPKDRPYKVPVVFRNETDHDIALPVRCVVAELSVAEDVISTQNTSSCCSYAQPINHTDQQQCETGSTLTFDFGESLPGEWKARITEKLNTFSDVFSHHDLDYGQAGNVKHCIKLKDETPFKQRPRPIHPSDFDAVRRHLKSLLQAKIIRESQSPFASPIVVVKKKNGDVRLCVDYRKLNMQTVKDAYALPNLEESFSALSGSQWFSVMDLKSGYYQIEMEESDKAKTAFVCPLGFWEWNRMPQGITNAPSTFQRLMEKCMGDINLREVLVFLDDIIVFSRTLEEHETRLTRVLNRLRENGLKLSPEKCRFFQTSVRYLGHIVSRNGVETDPKKTEALKTWPRPQTLKDLRSFLGFSGYYRRFVEGYSQIVKPLTNLTAGYPPLKRGAKMTKQTTKYHNPNEPFGERWTEDCQDAFTQIIEKLISPPVLGFADPKLPYVLHTDASTTGLGAALYQEQNGQTRVIAYASRGLSQCEARYPAHKLEFLALKWAITEKFHDYLYGNVFTVLTDNNPLRYVLTKAKLDATGYRWLAALSTFTFDIKYRAGNQNQDADGLSRRPHGELTNDSASQEESARIHEFTSHHLTPVDAVQATCQYHIIQNETDLPPCHIGSLAVHPDAIPSLFEADDEDISNLSTLPKYSEAEMSRLQREDPAIGAVIKLYESGNSAPTDTRSQELHLMLKEMSRFEMRDSLLFRKRKSDNKTIYQLVLPQTLRLPVLHSLHDEMGHLGIERTLELARSRFYWPKMSSDVESKVKKCPRCVKRKSQPERAAPLVNIQTSHPMELVCMDFLSIEPDSHNFKDILVITDHFTKYAVAIPTKDQKAVTVAKCLWEQFLIHYGFPERLHSDQGRDFESQIIKELCALVGIKKVRTSPYHPRGNPVERYNRTLLSMLGTLKDKEKSRWREYVRPLTHAYNCTKNEVTGFSPYELMFGRQPRLPIDIAFGLPVKEGSTTSHSQYVRNLKSYLKDSYQLASDNAKKVADKNKRRFDMKIREATLNIGDRVLVRNLRFRGKHKLADRWESATYVVQKKAGDMPVYTVCPEGQDGPLRTLHRDLLLPCGFLPDDEEEVVKPKQPSKPKTRQTPVHPEQNTSDSDEEDHYGAWFYPNIIRTTTRVVGPYHPSPSKDVIPVEQEPDVRSKPSQGIDNSEDLPSPSTVLDPAVEKENGIVDEHLPDMTQREKLQDATPNESGNMTESHLPDVTQNELEFDKTRHCEYGGKELEGNSADVSSTNESTEGDEKIQDQMKSTQLDSVLHNQTNTTKDANQSGQTIDPVRRSQRSRKPPVQFTYPQLGKPLISFAQTILNGFNKAVETFEDALYFEKEHEGTHVDSGGEGVTHLVI